MTLDEAAKAWRELGIIQMRNHGDHCCAAPMPAHTLADCPLTPHLNFRAEDVAEIEDDRGLNRLMSEKLQADSDARARAYREKLEKLNAPDDSGRQPVG